MPIKILTSKHWYLVVIGMYYKHIILKIIFLQRFQKCIPNPGIEPRSPTLQVHSLLAEPQGKPKNTGVGSLSLLEQIFPTQESNQGLLLCRQTLYQLSYQGSPPSLIMYYKCSCVVVFAREYLYVLKFLHINCFFCI